MRVRVELTVEPFREGVVARHVEAALEALRSAGFEPEIGPLSSAVEGDPGSLFDAVSRASKACFAAGATGFALTARALADDDETEQFLAALRPVTRALGGHLLPPDRMCEDSLPLVWKGRVVAGLEAPRPNDLRRGLSNLVAQIETELHGQLAELSRADKQRAVRMLDERGAFAIRNAVDDVADAMGVSRVTVYNYLHAARSRRPGE